MPKRSRQLAAIMFTDIVGYTALMGEDEEKAFELLKKNRLIQRPIIESFNGRWLKEMGDGVLASFNSVSEAVYCAGAIQKACETEPDLKLRIGIHEGEVVFEGVDVFGDGVNIASRLEPLAPVGGIIVSEAVNRDLGNKKGIETNFVREETLKNVKDPVRIYQVKVDETELSNHESAVATNYHEITPSGSKPSIKKKIIFGASVLIVMLLGYIFYNNISSKEEAIENTSQPEIIDKSIAVLPFTDMSSEEGNEYFANGLAEELINALSKLEKLRVAARTSSFSFQETQVDAAEIGNKLNVNYLLQGSVRKEGEAIRISVELIDTKDGFQVWSDSYDRRLDSVFELQDEITRTILGKLKIQLSGQEYIRLSEHGTQNKDALLAYLKGRYHWNKRTPEDLLLAEEYFTLAIQEDSLYASAYSGLADSYSITMAYGLRDPQEIALKAMAAATRALEIGPELAEAYVSLAFAKILFERDWKTANENFQEAILLNSDYPTAHHWYPLYFISQGMMQEALNEVRKALLLDPLSPIINAAYGHFLYIARQYDEALIQIRQTLELTPNMHRAHFILGNILLEKNKPEEALTAYTTAFQLAETSLTIGALGRAYGLLGEKAKALEMLDALNKKAEKEFVPSIFYAWIYLGLGQKEVAINWLGKAVEEPGLVATLYLGVYPFYDDLQDFQQFMTILDQLDLQPAK